MLPALLKGHMEMLAFIVAFPDMQDVPDEIFAVLSVNRFKIKHFSTPLNDFCPHIALPYFGNVMDFPDKGNKKV